MGWTEMGMLEIIVLAGLGVISYFGVQGYRGWALRWSVLDVPNERSSHSVPTPRGGGLVIVVLVLGSYTVLSLLNTSLFSWGFLTGASLIALVGWIDDLRSLSYAWRLAAQVAAASILLADLGPLDFSFLVNFGGYSSVFNIFLTFLWLLWLVNAYNFMDGIDGMAALQAVIFCTGLAILCWLSGSRDLSLFFAAAASITIGFLVVNWNPAKVFMGDVGSSFLGFTFASAPLLASRTGDTGSRFLLPATAVFLWCFLFDTFVSRLARFRHGIRIWQPHRSHLYQRMVEYGWSHSSVAALYGGFSGFLVLQIILFAALTGIHWVLIVFSLCAISVLLLAAAFRKTV